MPECHISSQGNYVNHLHLDQVAFPSETSLTIKSGGKIGIGIGASVSTCDSAANPY